MNYNNQYEQYTVMLCVLFSFRYCDGRCQVLLDHVHEGYDSELWEYHDD